MQTAHQSTALGVRRLLGYLTLLMVVVLALAACADEADPEPEDTDDDVAEDLEEDPDDTDDDVAEEREVTLTMYSGRSEELIEPIVEQFREDTGTNIEVRYGDTLEMAATILEEGENSPADLFFGQDAGALGALKEEGRLVDLSPDVIDAVDARFVDPGGQWIGTSGRARVIAYNTDLIDPEDLPETLLDVADPQWEGRVGWAPTNGSLQAHITAMRTELGDDVVEEWASALAEQAVVFENNTAIVDALGRGEVEIGITNHYYLYRFLAEDPDFPVDNAFLADGDIGNLINIAGLGVLDTSAHPEEAEAFIAYLLTEDAQQYFAEEVFEFPVVDGVEGDPRIPATAEIATPEIDLSDLADLEGTVALLQRANALP